MASKYHRAQILLEPEQHHELAEIAQRKGRSVSDVVREYVGQGLTREKRVSDTERARRMAVMEEIGRFRERIIRDNGGKELDFDVVQAINDARDEQDRRNLGLGG